MDATDRKERKTARLAAALAALALVAAAAPFALRVAAFAREPDALAVLRYDRIGAGPDAVRPDLFYAQLRDLVEGGFSVVSPRRVRQRVSWGRRLPPDAVLLSVGDVDPECATTVSEALSEYGFPALVGDEMAALAGVGFSRSRGIARVGRGSRASAPLSLPCLRAVPGDLSFSAVVARDAKTPGEFGTLFVSQPAGGRFPVSVLVYRPGDARPFVQADLPELPRDGACPVPLPADAAFPLEVLFYGQDRILFYHAVSVPRSGVVRPEGWRTPLAGPEGEVALEDL